MEATVVSEDYGLLMEYLPLYFARAAESEHQRRARERRRRADPQGEARRQARNQTAIPHGVELWIGHLADLDLLSEGIALGINDLEPQEVRGLGLYRRARREFLSQHCRCPRCGGLNHNSAKWCGSCGYKPEAGGGNTARK
jgi:hypothetical protein